MMKGLFLVVWLPINTIHYTWEYTNCTCWKACVCMLSHVWLFVTPWMEATRLLCSWCFPGKNSEAGCHFLLQGIFPTQGSNPQLLYLLHWQVGFLGVFCIFFSNSWATTCWQIVSSDTNLTLKNISINSYHNGIVTKLSMSSLILTVACNVDAIILTLQMRF